MLSEVCVESRGVIVFLAIFADHWIKFFQISLSEVVKPNFHSIEECLCLLFDPFQRFLSDIAVKGGNIYDFFIFVDVVPRSRCKQPIALTLLFELKEVVSWLGSLNWLKFV